MFVSQLPPRAIFFFVQKLLRVFIRAFILHRRESEMNSRFVPLWTDTRSQTAHSNLTYALLTR